MAGLHVGLGGTAGQSLSVHEVTKRVTGCDQDVDTHVELEVIDEEGLRDCVNPPGKIIIWSSLSILRKGVSGAPWIPKASDTQVFYIQRSSVMNTVCSLNPWISAPPDSPSYGQNFTLVEFADVRPMDMTHR